MWCNMYINIYVDKIETVRYTYALPDNKRHIF